MDKNILIKVRGVITHDSKLLIVKHFGTGFMALPGGHLKFGEDIIACLKRELVEELGVLPEIGRLLYINTFMDKNEYVEFFFEVKNGKDYIDIDGLERTHARELVEILWVSSDSDIEILPKQFNKDFKSNKIFEGETKFISEL
ncbi:MAG: NUDIX domain-containing protein [Candidatus Paceibacterota bacterium]